MPHSHFSEPGKDYRLILDSQLVQKSLQKGEILQNPRGAPLGQQGDGLHQQACSLLGWCLPGETESYLLRAIHPASSCCFASKLKLPTPSFVPFLILTPHSQMEAWKGQFQRKEVINQKPFWVYKWVFFYVHGVRLWVCVCVLSWLSLDSLPPGFQHQVLLTRN